MKKVKKCLTKKKMYDIIISNVIKLCLSRNIKWRSIEVVITGRTRNVVKLEEVPTATNPDFTGLFWKFNIVVFSCSQRLFPKICNLWRTLKHIWSGIEVVITGLTRNQLTGNRPWVRIPPTPPFYEVFAKCKNLVFLWELTKSLWELINLQLLQEC